MGRQQAWEPALIFKQRTISLFVIKGGRGWGGVGGEFQFPEWELKGEESTHLLGTGGLGWSSGDGAGAVPSSDSGP
jgi:hypothetical protein